MSDVPPTRDMVAYLYARIEALRARVDDLEAELRRVRGNRAA